MVEANRSDLPTFRVLDLLGQPGAGLSPIAVGGALGEAKHFRRLMVGNSREEPQFNQFRADGILDRQLLQGVADEEQRLIVACLNLTFGIARLEGLGISISTPLFTVVSVVSTQTRMRCVAGD